MSRQLSSSFGFACMFGGVLFPALLIVMSGLLTERVPESGVAVADSVVLVTFFFFLIGVTGLYLAQREAFGVVGAVTTIVLAVGLALTIVDGLVSATSLTIPYADLLTTVAFVLLGLGTVSFGLATAKANVFLHGRLGGVLLAAAIPLMLVGSFALETLGVGDPVIASLVNGITFGLPWIILGLDLLTLSDYEAPVEDVDVG